MSDFIHLHVHSAYSLAEGAIKVKDLVKLAKQEKMPAVAMTDSNNLFGAMEFALEAADKGIQPIIGAQVLVGEEECQLVLLAQNVERKRLSDLRSTISDLRSATSETEAVIHFQHKLLFGLQETIFSPEHPMRI